MGPRGVWQGPCDFVGNGGARFGVLTPMSTATRSPGLVYWIPVDEAVRRFAVTREDLTAAARSGDLDVRAKVIGGEVVASVSSADLTARYGPPVAASGARPKQQVTTAAPETEAELARVHGQLVAAKDRARILDLDRARLQGALETAEKIERNLQRYADRLETRIEDTRAAYEHRLQQAEAVRLQLARLVGQMEAEVMRMQQQIDQLKTERRAALPAPAAAPRRRRFWPFA